MWYLTRSRARSTSKSIWTSTAPQCAEMGSRASRCLAPTVPSCRSSARGGASCITQPWRASPLRTRRRASGPSWSKRRRQGCQRRGSAAASRGSRDRGRSSCCCRGTKSATTASRSPPTAPAPPRAAAVGRHPGLTSTSTGMQAGRRRGSSRAAANAAWPSGRRSTCQSHRASAPTLSRAPKSWQGQGRARGRARRQQSVRWHRRYPRWRRRRRWPQRQDCKPAALRRQRECHWVRGRR
mmetsp:Transcript_55383/g.152526  ORF Transcript_55383/g.152526 Transcript_55383/m.152526 type:complete len:239 (-) Transcript_55383:211-927(-)